MRTECLLFGSFLEFGFHLWVIFRAVEPDDLGFDVGVGGGRGGDAVDDTNIGEVAFSAVEEDGGALFQASECEIGLSSWVFCFYVFQLNVL